MSDLEGSPIAEQVEQINVMVGSNDQSPEMAIPEPVEVNENNYVEEGLGQVPNEHAMEPDDYLMQE